MAGNRDFGSAGAKLTIPGAKPAAAKSAPGLVGVSGAPASTTAKAAPADQDALIKEGTDASFMADVVEASRTQPVVVDFWAPWCGPCRQLTPALEKAVTAAGGAVRLVKINIDQNPAVAGQLRVQSIPTVYAFDNGQPVDAFQGALPESQVKAFIDRLAGPPATASGVDEMIALAKESLVLGDVDGAAQAYAGVLQAEPDNVAAIAGLARCYLMDGDVARAAEIAAMAPADAKDADLQGVRAALSLAAAASGETTDADRRVAADPNDYEARFDLAKALAARGDLQGAVDHLLILIEKDRGWNDEAARKQLLTIFEAAPPGSDVARNGRRRLSALLFA